MARRGIQLLPEEQAKISYAWEVELFLKGIPFEYIENLPIVRRRQIVTYQNGVSRADREEAEANKWRHR